MTKRSNQTDFAWNGMRCPLSTDRKVANIPSYSSKNIAVRLHGTPTDNCRPTAVAARRDWGSLLMSNQTGIFYH